MPDINHHTVLAFHKIQKSFSYSVNNFPPDKLFALIAYLQKQEYTFIRYDEFQEKNTDKAILLTFDDGYEHLTPILSTLAKQYHIFGHVFLPTDWIGKQNSWDYSYLFQKLAHLSETSIKTLSNEGITFGSHGCSHRDLTSLPSDELSRELVKSKEVLQAVTGGEVSSISYPFGRYNQQVLDETAKVGYKQGFTIHISFRNPITRFSNTRVPVYGFESIKTVYNKASIGKPTFRYTLTNDIIRFLSGGTTWWQRIKGKK